MTDYLALALEQREERRDETPAGTLAAALERGESGLWIGNCPAEPAGEKGRRPGEPLPALFAPLEQAGEELGGVVGEKGVFQQEETAHWEQAGEVEETIRLEKVGETQEDFLLRQGSWAGGEFPLSAALRRVQREVEFSRQQLPRTVSVSLPETAAPEVSWGAEELDHAVERDARRYDGGFSLY